MVHVPDRGRVQQLAPDTAVCPRCHTLCSRHERVLMHRWQASLAGPRQLCVEAGAYLCPDCPTGQRWFRLHVPGFVAGQQYSPLTKRLLLSLVRDYNLSFLAAAHFARTWLHLPDLHDSTVGRWFAEAGAQFDYPSHLQQVRAVFSGQMAVDEVYDNGIYVLRVTDPLNGLELTSWLGRGAPDAEEVHALFQELQEAGIEPLLVVTDGSGLYPAAIAAVWPEAEHQQCVFHFLQNALVLLSKSFWAAHGKMPKPLKRRPGRPKKRGGRRKDKPKQDNRNKVRQARYLLFKREGLDPKGRALLSEEQQASLAEVLSLCPALTGLRRFVVALYELFGPTTTTVEVAEQRRTALLCEPAFQDDAGMASVLQRLAEPALWARLTRYLHYEGAQKTSNHAERANREYRRRQRSHYRLRATRALWALLNFTLQARPQPTTPVRLTRRRPIEPPTKEVTPS